VAWFVFELAIIRETTRIIVGVLLKKKKPPAVVALG
jgi:hypothetical protein